jgi:hypothetical protein
MTMNIEPPLPPAVSVQAPAVTGGEASSGVVVIPAPVNVATNVSLRSSYPMFASVPAMVTFPAGEENASFAITTTSPPAPMPIAITATWFGTSGSAQLTLNPQIVVTSLSLSPPGISAGEASIASFTLSRAAESAGATVTVGGVAKGVSVPATVAIAPGVATGSFKVVTDASAPPNASISAFIGTGTPVSAMLTVYPFLSSLTVPLSGVTGQTLTGTIRFSNAVPVATTVNLTSSAPLSVSVPPSVTIPAMSGSADFVFSITKSAPAGNAIITATAAKGQQMQTAKIEIAAMR